MTCKISTIYVEITCSTKEVLSLHFCYNELKLIIQFEMYICHQQVADFGLAKLAMDANTHVTTRVMGTFG